jgi:decaprenyl-phosphate phosphoribosyltransferase
LKAILKLFRVEHYLKNVLIFLPLFFNEQLLSWADLSIVIFGFIAFCLISSAVYIFNDIQDCEKDKQHPKKRFRRIASGVISVKLAFVLFGLSLAFSLVFSLLTGHLSSLIYLSIYLLLNIGYSLGLKNKPLIDIAILSSGFLLRLMYGAVLGEVLISGWLYLTVISGSLYLGLGKRRNEFDRSEELGKTREVLKYYNYSFLDKNMYVYMALSITFYSLWALQYGSHLMVWTVPIIYYIHLYEIQFKHRNRIRW